MGMRQEFFGAGKIGDIGIELARKYRIAFQPIDLCIFDFAIPIRTFHQAHADAVVIGRGEFFEVVKHIPGTFLIGLHRKANPIPSGIGTIA